jgi:hypothetical protein
MMIGRLWLEYGKWTKMTVETELEEYDRNSRIQTHFSMEKVTNDGLPLV